MAKIRKCSACGIEIDKDIVDNNFAICPNCGHYLRYHAYRRIEAVTDYHSFIEWDADMKWSNPLEDSKYVDKLQSACDKHGLKEAIVTGEASIDGNKIAIGVMDSRFMMASMGYVVGEKVVRLFEKATRKKLPVVLFCCSGGARMQEGIISLMQMEKTAAALKKHDKAGLLYITILTDPTYGGVGASFAFPADIILAEKGAMIGFAGPRVIEQNTGVKLPKGFQTAEFQLEHGFVDDIVDREQMKAYLGRVLTIHSRKNKKLVIKNTKNVSNMTYVDVTKLTPWETVQRARMPERPTTKQYIESIFDAFLELHGDRAYGDDHAVIGGIAEINGFPVTVLGTQKGKNSMDEAIFYNFGMASPSGYKKAIRLMKQAEKFNRPVICFVDTIGAACGKEAEEQGQGYTLAEGLKEMSALKVPVMSIVHGEGGSGGALAFSIANEVCILECAVYSILTPEGYASILWKNSELAYKAAEEMQLKSTDLLRLHVVDKIFPEPLNFTQDNIMNLGENMKQEILRFIKTYRFKTKRQIVKQRYNRFRRF